MVCAACVAAGGGLQRRVAIQALWRQLTDAQLRMQGRPSPGQSSYSAMAAGGQETDAALGLSLFERLRHDLRREPRQRVRHTSAAAEGAWLRQLSRQRAHIADLTAALNLYSDTADYLGLSFKPSTHKGDATLRYIATNLHVHRLLVYRAPLPSVAEGDGDDGDGDDDGTVAGPPLVAGAEAQRAPTPLTNLDDDSGRGSDAPIDSFCVVTVGAPAAHAMGFKEGGVSCGNERRGLRPSCGRRQGTRHTLSTSVETRGVEVR